MFWVHLWTLVGVGLQVLGLGWATFAVVLAWRREWPRERILPAEVAPWAKAPEVFERDAVGDLTLGGIGVVGSVPTVEERLNDLGHRVAAIEGAVVRNEDRIGQVSAEAEANRKRDIERLESRARAQARASIIGAPILIILGTLLQIISPIVGLANTAP